MVSRSAYVYELLCYIHSSMRSAVDGGGSPEQSGFLVPCRPRSLYRDRLNNLVNSLSFRSRQCHTTPLPVDSLASYPASNNDTSTVLIQLIQVGCHPSFIPRDAKPDSRTKTDKSKPA